MQNNILIIEDSSHWAKDLQKYCGDAGENIVTHIIASFEDAKNYLTESQPDIIILDGEIIGGHTKDLIHLCPKEKTIIVSASDPYNKEMQALGYIIHPKTSISRKEFVASIKQILEI